MVWRSKFPEPLPGTTYGEWTVKEDYRKTHKTQHDRLLVECSCGAKRTVTINTLVSGRSTSCGHKTGRHNSERWLKEPSRYLNRIGEYFGDYLLSHYTESDNLRHFTLTCPKKHEHVFHTYTTPSGVLDYGFHCWCQEEDPVVRIRKRKGYAQQTVADALGVSKVRVSQHEKTLKEYHYAIKRYAAEHNPCRANENIESLTQCHAFQQLATAYRMNPEQQRSWLDEIIGIPYPVAERNTPVSPDESLHHLNVSNLMLTKLTKAFQVQTIRDLLKTSAITFHNTPGFGIPAQESTKQALVDWAEETNYPIEKEPLFKK